MNKSPTPTEPKQALADAEAEHARLLGELTMVRNDMDKLRLSEKNLAHQVSSAHSMVCELQHRMRTLQIENSPWCRVQRTRGVDSWIYYGQHSEGPMSQLDYFSHLGNHIMVRFPDGAQEWLVLTLVNVAGEGGPEDMRPGVFVVLHGLSTFIELSRLEVRRDSFAILP